MKMSNGEGGNNSEQSAVNNEQLQKKHEDIKTFRGKDEIVRDKAPKSVNESETLNQLVFFI